MVVPGHKAGHNLGFLREPWYAKKVTIRKFKRRKYHLVYILANTCNYCFFCKHTRRTIPKPVYYFSSSSPAFFLRYDCSNLSDKCPKLEKPDADRDVAVGAVSTLYVDIAESSATTILSMI